MKMITFFTNLITALSIYAFCNATESHERVIFLIAPVLFAIVMFSDMKGEEK